MRVPVLALLLAGCSDYSINAKDDDPNMGADDPDAIPDDGHVGGTGGGEDSGGAGDEDCNGVDDDGDGEVDEGFPDLDGDGIADCVDDDCPLDLASAGSVDLDPDCETADVEVVDPWDVAIEWQWTGLSSRETVRHSFSTPVIAPLRDDNGDGVVDTRDTPDVAFTTVSGFLVVLSGADGSERWAVDGIESQAGVAFADLDTDGIADVLTVDADGHPVLFDAAGVLLWTAPEAVTGRYPQPSVGDLDGDGVPEALVDDLVLDGRTGAVEARLPATADVPYRMATSADLDLDGSQEVLFADGVYDGTGALAWSSGLSGPWGLWSAPIDVDGDPEAEVLFFGGGELVVFEADGTVVSRTADPAWDRPGPPCVADFDGDGAVEVAFASYDVLSLVELDGQVVWDKAIDDSSGLAGCSGYDFDADGAYEVVYADQQRLFILDGATGSVRFRQRDHASVTALEYPVIADLDADGSAEVVFVSNYWDEGWGGLTVLGHAGDGWARSGTAWPVHDFAVTNLTGAGRVPASPYPPWRLYNVMRARPTSDGAAVDLAAHITDVCVSGCDPEVGVVRVAAQVWNEGVLDAPSGLTLALWAEAGGSPVLLDTVTLPAVPSGEALGGVELRAPSRELAAGPLFIVVDDDAALGPGRVLECDEQDNRDAWADDPCAG